MDESHTYQVKSSWLGQRKGIVRSNGIEQEIEVATPPEFAKGVAGIWSPEHLFIASVGSCFMITFLAVAENFKLEFASFSCDAIGKLECINGRSKITQITLHPVLAVAEGNAIEKGLKVLGVTEKACLISNSVNSEIIFAPQIIVDAKQPKTLEPQTKSDL